MAALTVEDRLTAYVHPVTSVSKRRNVERWTFEGCYLGVTNYTHITLTGVPQNSRQLAQGQARPGWPPDRWRGE